MQTSSAEVISPQPPPPPTTRPHSRKHAKTIWTGSSFIFYTQNFHAIQIYIEITIVQYTHLRIAISDSILYRQVAKIRDRFINPMLKTEFEQSTDTDE